MANATLPNARHPVFQLFTGWLLLMTAGVLALPLRLFLFIYEDLLPAFSAEAWSLLTTPGTMAYHPLNRPVLLFELTGNLVLLAAALLLAVLFFQRRRRFPPLMAGFLTLALAFYVADYFAAHQLPAVADYPDPDSIRDLIGAFFICAGVIAYLRRSTRVKASFVR